jgi:nitroreductase
MDALDAIYQRRAVRSYTGQKIDRETMKKLLSAAVRAPTAVHEEPWAFAIVQDPALLRRISDRVKSLWPASLAERHGASALPSASHFAELLAQPDFNVFYDAPTLIVICARPMGPFVAADCWLAAENLMLAACASGLGTCVIGSAVTALNAPEAKAELGIPADVEAVAPIIVGYPRATTAATPRKAPEILSWK